MQSLPGEAATLFLGYHLPRQQLPACAIPFVGAAAPLPRRAAFLAMPASAKRVSDIAVINWTLRNRRFALLTPLHADQYLRVP